MGSCSSQEDTNVVMPSAQKLPTINRRNIDEEAETNVNSRLSSNNNLK